MTAQFVSGSGFFAWELLSPLVNKGQKLELVQVQSIDSQRKHAAPNPRAGVGAKGTRLFAPSSAA